VVENESEAFRSLEFCCSHSVFQLEVDEKSAATA